jgi:fibronectin-binding autotransporter adhesin
MLNRIDFETQGSGGANSFVVSGNQLSFQGGSLIYIYAGAPQTINNDIEIAGSDLTVQSLTVKSITLNGHISGSGGLGVVYSSVLLTNSNSYQGMTRIGASNLPGSLTISHGQALGAPGTGGVILSLSSQIRLSGGIIVDSKPLTMSSGSGYNSNGLKNIGGNNVWTGPINLLFTAAFWSQSPGETLTVNGDIEGNNNAMQMGGIGDIVVSGAIRNLHWDLSKYGTGTLTLAGNNSNIEQIVVSDGILVAAHGSALPYNTPIQLNPNSGVPLQDAHPTLRIEEDTTIGGLSGSSYGGTAAVQLGSHILTINQAYYSSCGVALTGSGSIVKAGVGVLELSAVSDFTGGSVIRGGALRISQDRALGAVPAVPTVKLTIDGGELQPSPSSVPLMLHVNRTILLQGPASVTSFSSQAPLILPGQIIGPGTLTKNGSYGVTLSNPNNSYAGGTLINTGTLRFDNPGAIAPGGMVKISKVGIAASGYAIDQTFLSRIDPESHGIIALAVDSANDLDFNSPGLSNVSFGAIGTQTYGGAIVAAEGGYRLGGPGVINLARENALNGNTSVHIGLDPSAAGRVILSNNNSLKGDTIVHGGTLEVSASTLSCNQLEVGPQATLQLTSGAVATNVIVQATGTLRGCGTVTGSLTNNGSVIINCTPGLAVAGSIINNGNMTFLGGATVTAGGSFVNDGLLDLLTSPGATLPPGFINNGTVVYPGDVKIRSMSKSGTTFSLKAQSLTGHNYQLQRTSTLGNANWQNVGTPAAGNTGSDITLVDSTAALQQFYRIQVSP